MYHALEGINKEVTALLDHETSVRLRVALSLKGSNVLP